MDDRLLIDTDVLIDYLREQPDAVAYLEGRVEHLLVSTITIAELYSGVREGAERQSLDTLLPFFEEVDVDVEIAIKGGLFRRGYRKSHNLGLAAIPFNGA